MISSVPFVTVKLLLPAKLTPPSAPSVDVIAPCVLAVLVPVVLLPMIVTDAFVAFNATAASILTPTPAEDFTVTSPVSLVALALPAVLLPVILRLSEVQVPLKVAPAPEKLCAVAVFSLALDAVLLPAVLMPTSVNVPPV